MIAVQSSDDVIQISIPRGDIRPETLDAWVEWLRLESIAGKSQMAEDEADRLAEESKTAWWSENRHRFLPSGS